MVRVSIEGFSVCSELACRVRVAILQDRQNSIGGKAQEGVFLFEALST